MTELATIEQNVALQVTPRSELTPLGWVATEEIDLDECVEAARQVGHLNRASQWALGDLMNYSATRWGEKYRKVAAATGYDNGTLRNMASIAQQFEMSRRRDNLSWSHHAAVASLEPAEQEVVLDRAEQESLSSKALRPDSDNGNGSKAKPDPTDPLTSTIAIGGRTLSMTFNNKNLKRRTEEALRAHAEDVGYE